LLVVLRVGELFQDVIAPLLVRLKIPLQDIRKEKDPQDGKHDKQFDQDDPPQFAAPGHAPETVPVESEYVPENPHLREHIDSKNLIF
jgi:hypothetical protein